MATLWDLASGMRRRDRYGYETGGIKPAPGADMTYPGNSFTNASEQARATAPVFSGNWWNNLGNQPAARGYDNNAQWLGTTDGTWRSQVPNVAPSSMPAPVSYAPSGPTSENDGYNKPRPVHTGTEAGAPADPKDMLGYGGDPAASANEWTAYESKLKELQGQYPQPALTKAQQAQEDHPAGPNQYYDRNGNLQYGYGEGDPRNNQPPLYDDPRNGIKGTLGPKPGYNYNALYYMGGSQAGVGAPKTALESNMRNIMSSYVLYNPDGTPDYAGMSDPKFFESLPQSIKLKYTAFGLGAKMKAAAGV